MEWRLLREILYNSGSYSFPLMWDTQMGQTNAGRYVPWLLREWLLQQLLDQLPPSFASVCEQSVCSG